MSKYREIVKKTKTIGKSLNGDIKASNNLSSNSLEVFKTIFLTLLTINLANIPLIKRAMIKDKMIIPKLKRLTPRTPFCNKLYT